MSYSIISATFYPFLPFPCPYVHFNPTSHPLCGHSMSLLHFLGRNQDTTIYPFPINRSLPLLFNGCSVMKEYLISMWFNWLSIHLLHSKQILFYNTKKSNYDHLQVKVQYHSSPCKPSYLFRWTHSSTLSFSQPSSVFTQASPGDRQSLEMKGILAIAKSTPNCRSMNQNIALFHPN